MDLTAVLANFLDSYLRFNLHGLLNLTAALFGFSVGVIVLWQNPRSSVNRSFFYLTTSTCIWLVGFGMASLVRRDEDAWPWVSMDYFLGVPFIPVFFYFLSANLAQKKDDRFFRLVCLIWATLAAIPMVLMARQTVFLDNHGWGRYLTYRFDSIVGTYVPFLLIPFLGLLFISMTNFLRAFKDAVSPSERRQRRNIVIAVLLAYTGAFDFLRGFNVPVYPFGYISLSLFIGIVAYNIVRHQFFEINIVLKKFAIVLLLYSFLFAITVPVLSFLINKAFPQLLPQQMLAIIFLGVIIGLILASGPLVYATVLERAFWLKGHSTTGLAHELKSPLAAIQGAAQGLLYRHEKGQENANTFDYLHIIERNAERLKVFVQDLLRIAQIQNEDVTVQKELLDFAQLIRDVASTYEPVAQAGDVDLLLDLQTERNIEGDSEKLRQVVSNLLNNALKFTTSGFVSVSLMTERYSLRCTVADSGSGIAPENIERIFNRFYHGTSSTKGSGLGLTIAKAWVEAHGGKIWAESEGEGKGTTVTFTLPV